MYQKLYDGGFLFSPKTGMTTSLTLSASEIWDTLQTCFSLELIVAELVKKYPATDVELLTADVSETLKKFYDLELLCRVQENDSEVEKPTFITTEVLLGPRSDVAHLSNSCLSFVKKDFYTQDWAYLSPIYRALDYTFRFECVDPVIGAEVASHLSTLEISGIDADMVTNVYYLGKVDDPTLDDFYATMIHIAFDHKDLGQSPVVRDLLSLLFWHINHHAVHSKQGYLQLHAAHVTWPDNKKTFIFPGVSNAGKSTLTTALLLQGGRYGSDEVTVIDSLLSIHPYTKPIALDPPTYTLFSDTHIPNTYFKNWPRQHPPGRWFLLPNKYHQKLIESEHKSGSSCEIILVFPQYKKGQELQIVELSPREAVSELVQHCFDLRSHAEVTIPILAKLINTFPCYSMTYGIVDDAVTGLQNIVEWS